MNFFFNSLQGEWFISKVVQSASVPEMKELWASWQTRIITPCLLVVRALGVLLFWGWGGDDDVFLASCWLWFLRAQSLFRRVCPDISLGGFLELCWFAYAVVGWQAGP